MPVHRRLAARTTSITLSRILSFPPSPAEPPVFKVNPPAVTGTPRVLGSSNETAPKNAGERAELHVIPLSHGRNCQSNWFFRAVQQEK